MKYEKINRELFIKNRAKFIAQMAPKSIAIFNSNDIYPISADSTMPFQQHRDIFYLTGADQEETILVLFPDAFNEEHREMLFVRETNEHIAVWEGEKLTKEAALDRTGIKDVYWLDQFDTIMKVVMAQAENVYLNTNEHTRANTTVETREDRFIKDFKVKYPVHNIKKSAPIMHSLRAIKDSIEIDLMQTACNITEKAFRRILGFIKPGVTEYEIEAEIMHEFLRNRSKGFAYTPIIASGNNANVLHYIENNQVCNDGDVILMDFAAEYANYASDLSRSVPVNGKYSPRQKDVYNAVLRVKKASENLLVPGTYLAEYHKEVGKLMESELVGLGLLDSTDLKNQDPKWPAYKKYFMHGTSHFIGLDTHDVGSWTKPIEAGMVFTCEPGIYIPAEGLGIRIEDDLVVQANGAPKNLMGNIPIEIEEIEDLMNA
ncbi:aminopeptidase P N-terminal domain-containing protein [Crocinitomix catalasitica]|uniref:aminopeptidase P N-terminal domain-containing protein n=1 Tax=Crocinitomix catalasitica TaxID=184607 RepID=UPI0004811D79|nr:aminopeptidase P N-terminal domain-containing protein [Crocinitomix catalasitica]